VYGKSSVVVPPPVDVPDVPSLSARGDYYVTASRLVPYKRIDLIIKAFNAMPDKRLVVIGSGPLLAQFKQLAGSNVDVMGYQPQNVLEQHLANAKAFVFAAEEDFGIAPVEAQAYGTPVIAFGKGGILDSVIDGETGIFFPEQTTDAVSQAIKTFESRAEPWDHRRIASHALEFRPEAFRKQLSAQVDAALAIVTDTAEGRRRASKA